MPPVRTRFEERLVEAREHLVAYAQSARTAFSLGVSAYLQLDAEAVQQVAEMRRSLRSGAWHLEEELLMLLSLHHPLTLDLRTVAAYLRSVESFERMARHARDVARAANELDGRRPPEPISTFVSAMAAAAIAIQEEVVSAIESGQMADEALIRRLWTEVSGDLDDALDELSELGKKQGVPRRDRLVHGHVLRRLERSAYNAVRVADFWHHALTGHWVVLEDDAYLPASEDEE